SAGVETSITPPACSPSANVVDHDDAQGPMVHLCTLAARAVMIHGMTAIRSTLSILVATAALSATLTTAAQSGWTPLWNGRNLEGWTTWMRQPEPTSDVPGLPPAADGRYTEAIGSDRDPLTVFTVAPDVDGAP